MNVKVARNLVVFLTVAGIVYMSPAAWAQPGFDVRLLDRAASSDEDEDEDAEFPGGAALKTNPELERLLKRADQFAKSGRYDLAAILWQRVLDESANTLMSRRDWIFKTANHKYQKYKSVSEEIERTLAKMHPAGLKTYRLTADGEARAILATGNETNQEEVLSKVVQRMFLSSHGDDAAFKLACLALDRHDFVGAGRLLSRVLNDHPDPTVGRGQLLLRMAVANARIGDEKAARKALAAAETASPRPDRDTLTLVRQYVQQTGAATVVAPISPRDWHMALGDPTRHGRMKALPTSATRSTLTELWAVDFELKPSAMPPGQHVRFHGGFFDVPDPERMIEVAEVRVARRVVATSYIRPPTQVAATTSPAKLASPVLINKWKESGWFPTGSLLFDGGRVYFKTHDRLLCCDAASGNVLWRSAWSNAYQSDPTSQMYLMMRGMRAKVPGASRPTALHEVMLFGDRVHQSMSISGGMIFSVEGKSGGHGETTPSTDNSMRSRRVAMSRGRTPRRSRRNWLAAYDTATGKSKWYRSADDSDATANYEVGFLGAPVPYARLLIVPVTDSGSLWLYALDRDSGKTIWKTFLCDEPIGGASPWSPVGLAVDGGDAYVASGAGVVFAVSATSGDIRWAVRYQRTGRKNPMMQRYWGSNAAMLLDLDGWDEDIVIPHGSRLVVLASDYNQLFALDRRTGEFLWDSPRTPLEVPPGQYCLGVVGDNLFVAGRNIVRCYGIGRGGRLVWQRKIENSSGRGVLTEDAIYMPIKDSVARIELEKGTIETQVGVSLPAELPVGNLFSDGDKLVAVGLGRIYALTNLESHLQTLARRIAKGDAEAQLARMRLLGRLGKMDEAVKDLRAAYARLLEHNGDSPARKALYESVVEMKLPTAQPLVTLDLMAIAEGLSAQGVGSVKQIEDELSALRKRILYSTFSTVRGKKPPGAAAAVLRITPACGDAQLLGAARQALLATVAKADAGRIHAALRHADTRVRIVATAAVSKEIFGDQAGTTLTKLMADDEEQVRLASARALANMGDGACLPVLVKLLESQELPVRVVAAQVLRGLTGKRFKFAAYEKPEKRAEAVKAWRQWVETEGKTAKLHYPIRESAILFGRTLICYYANNKVIELDAEGRQIWEKTLPQPWSCQGLPNGHRLIACYNGRQVVEYDAEGKEVWKKAGLPGNPSSAQRLDNGNTVIACSSAQKIVEVDPAGKTVWEVTVTGQPMDARRLENGLTLVALQSGAKVVEVDRAGKIVWEAPGMSGAFSAQPLVNGNILVSLTGSGRVVEIDRNRQTIWQKTGLSTPYCAQRLPNGNTLIVDSRGVTEYDSEGKTIWKKSGHGALRVCRY